MSRRRAPACRTAKWRTPTRRPAAQSTIARTPMAVARRTSVAGRGRLAGLPLERKLERVPGERGAADARRVLEDALERDQVPQPLAERVRVAALAPEHGLEELHEVGRLLGGLPLE